jgi:hypothetical protein
MSLTSALIDRDDVNRPQVLVVSYFGISWSLASLPRRSLALSASEGDEGGRTRMTEFYEDRGNGGGVKRGYISSRLVAHLSHS